ncbi:MAG: hypothetical protein ACP5E4_02970 [Candidatus Aenigmatarchaeota archaeon]
MDKDIISIIGERERYDIPVIPHKEYLTTQKIGLIRRIYERAVRELYDLSKSRVTVIGYLKPSKQKITLHEKKALQKEGIETDELSRYSIFAETSQIQTGITVFAEPYKVRDFFLPFECRLKRISDTSFYLESYRPTYLKAEGIELEKPSISFAEILKQLSGYSHMSVSEGKHVFRALTFPYIGCDFCSNISDGFGVTQFADPKEKSSVLEALQSLHQTLNNNRLGVPFSHFGILNLIGENDMRLIGEYRKKLRGRAHSVSWLNPCSEKEVKILKASEIKYYSDDEIFCKSSYRDLGKNLDLRYSLLMYSIRPKDYVNDGLWRRGIKCATKTLEGYAKTPAEKRIVYGTAIDPEKMPLLVGRTLSLSNAVGLESGDALTMLREIIGQNLDEITLNLSKEAKIREATTDAINPRIVAKIVMAEDKTDEGIAEAVREATGWTHKKAGQLFIQMVNEGHLVKKGDKYMLVDYSDFNLGE